MHIILLNFLLWTLDATENGDVLIVDNVRAQSVTSDRRDRLQLDTRFGYMYGSFRAVCIDT